MQTLADYAVTDRQREIVTLLEQMSEHAAAKQLGLSRSTINATKRAVRRRAESKNFAPELGMDGGLSDVERLKGRSFQHKTIGPDGQERLTWTKTTVDHANLERFAAKLVENICETVTPIKPRKPARLARIDDCLTVYPIGDLHMGLYCWAGDTDEDWDCDKSRSMMIDVLGEVMHESQNTKEALIVNLGDWFHTDTLENMTRRSGHHLDVDTRWSRVLDVGIDLMMHLIESALLKHETVRVINEIGNHDEQSSIMLSKVLSRAYRDNDRITIDTSPDEFHWYEFGQNLFGVNHGHKCKPEKLYQVMCEYDMGRPWGRCIHRHWLTGHIHHHKSLDKGTQQIEAFRTPIPGDNYAHSNGYRSLRSLESRLYHKDLGLRGGVVRMIPGGG